MKHVFHCPSCAVNLYREEHKANCACALAKLDLQTFFAVASPTTLASLLTDLESISIEAILPATRQLAADACAALVANVGPEEAEKLIMTMKG